MLTERESRADESLSAMSRERTVQALVVGLSVIALVAIIAVTNGDEIDETTARVLASALTIAIYLVLSLAGNSLRESDEPWAWLGAVSVLLCAGGALMAIWLWWVIDMGGNEESVARAAGIAALYALATSHGSLLVRRIGERSDAGTLARYATFAMGLVLATLLTYLLLSDDGDAIDSETLVVVAILYSLGTVISPLLRLAEPKGPLDQAD
jgi:drug/metabolite transporter (DMT)-like permease